jgi:hypothetical protein
VRYGPQRVHTHLPQLRLQGQGSGWTPRCRPDANVGWTTSWHRHRRQSRTSLRPRHADPGAVPRRRLTTILAARARFNRAQPASTDANRTGCTHSRPDAGLRPQALPPFGHVRRPRSRRPLNRAGCSLPGQPRFRSIGRISDESRSETTGPETVAPSRARCLPADADERDVGARVSQTRTVADDELVARVTLRDGSRSSSPRRSRGHIPLAICAQC